MNIFSGSTLHGNGAVCYNTYRNEITMRFHVLYVFKTCDYIGIVSYITSCRPKLKICLQQTYQDQIKFHFSSLYGM